ncbi:MAG: helix-turn-helix transcriptional regulator [Clostridia bacterium]|nr:helix-turn-helix transcriptional regulator [Clostridia bacterium]
MELILPEIVAVGIYNSAVAVKGRAVTKNRKTVMFEIELPVEDGGISSINSEQMPIQRDTLICAKPGQMRHTRLPYLCYYMHIIVREGSLYETLMDMPNFIKTDREEKYRALFERLCKYYGSGVQNTEMILQSIILEIVYSLTRDAKKLEARERIKSSNYAVIERTIAYIKEHPTEDLSLERVADMAGFSPIYFHNCFKASTGRTLHDYVEMQRIKMAADMLLGSDRTLTQIAYECGFSSQSYFSYAFKRRMGEAPREYAKRMFGQYGDGAEDE